MGSSRMQLQCSLAIGPGGQLLLSADISTFCLDTLKMLNMCYRLLKRMNICHFLANLCMIGITSSLNNITTILKFITKYRVGKTITTLVVPKISRFTILSTKIVILGPHANHEYQYCFASAGPATTIPLITEHYRLPCDEDIWNPRCSFWCGYKTFIHLVYVKWNVTLLFIAGCLDCGNAEKLLKLIVKRSCQSTKLFITTYTSL